MAWARRLVRETGTLKMLAAMTHAIKGEFLYQGRHEEARRGRPRLSRQAQGHAAILRFS
jgi:hypothetical protein